MEREIMRKSAFSLGVITASLLVAACGGSESEPAASMETPASSSEEADAPMEPATPAPGDVATLDGTALADFTGDPAAGDTAFTQCRVCHTVEVGQNRMGPSLAGVFGRAAGTVEGFQYSPAMTQSGITWTPEKLYQFLENPRHVVPGNRMAFAGIKAGQDRANVIAYLKAENE